MSMKPTFKSDAYEDGRTKQAFKDAADINKILYKAQKTGTISHLAKYQGEYGDFSDIDDLLSAHEKLERGKKIFQECPSEIRREFGNDPGAFFRFVNDPQNSDKIDQLLPHLAKQGTPRPDVLKKVAQATGGASLEQNSGVATPDPSPQGETPGQGE